jgi:predicted enzyme related to lactoylglutathione lyase
MSNAPKTFMKLIVADEEAMADYYRAVYGLKDVLRVQGESAGSKERFREVILSADGKMGGTFVLFNFVDRPKPRDQQSIAGWVVDDIEATRDRILANGGKLVGEIMEKPEHGVRVLFSEDPEGALSEIVQLAVPA